MKGRLPTAINHSRHQPPRHTANTILLQLTFALVYTAESALPLRIQLVTNEPVLPCLPSGAANTANFKCRPHLIFKYFFSQMLFFQATATSKETRKRGDSHRIVYQNLH